MRNSIQSVRVDVLFSNGNFVSYSVHSHAESAANYDPLDYVRRMLFSLGIFDANVMSGS